MRKLLGAGSVVLVVVGLVAAGRLWSHEKMPPARPDTRVGLINLTSVISNYNMYKAYKEDLKKQYQPYDDKIKELKEQVEALKKDYDAADPLSPKREEVEKSLKKLQADMEKVNEDAKKEFAPKAQDQMVLIYREVQATCERYAKAHDLEMVLQYNEPLDAKDYYSPANVERKMGAGALIPLYMAPGLDLTEEITAALNASK